MRIVEAIAMGALQTRIFCSSVEKCARSGVIHLFFFFYSFLLRIVSTIHSLRLHLVFPFWAVQFLLTALKFGQRTQYNTKVSHEMARWIAAHEKKKMKYNEIEAFFSLAELENSFHALASAIATGICFGCLLHFYEDVFFGPLILNGRSAGRLVGSDPKSMWKQQWMWKDESNRNIKVSNK